MREVGIVDVKTFLEKIIITTKWFFKASSFLLLILIGIGTTLNPAHYVRWHDEEKEQITQLVHANANSLIWKNCMNSICMYVSPGPRRARQEVTAGVILYVVCLELWKPTKLIPCGSVTYLRLVGSLNTFVCWWNEALMPNIIWKNTTIPLSKL